MAKYKANPVIVDAFKILEVGEPFEHDNPDINGIRTLRVEVVPMEATPYGAYTSLYLNASPAMMSRYVPKIGDYWVRQSDGYEYLNPSEVFERKYSPLPTFTPMEADGIEITKDGTVIGTSERVQEFEAFCRERGKLLR